MNNEKIYVIYAHINLLNGKTYIGQTKQTLSRRFRKDGEGYKKCTAFYKAILEDGWSNFKHIILFENLTLEEANLIEKYLIKKFDLTNEEKGYNISQRGEGISIQSSEIISQHNKQNWQNGVYDKIKNKIYCVELNKDFESALEAERQTGVDNSSIQKVCRNKLKYAGFSPNGDPLHWLFTENKTEDKIKELSFKKEILKGIKIPVYCPELNLFFDSATDATIQYHIDPSSIRKVIKKTQNSAGRHPITNLPLHWEEHPELINSKSKIPIDIWNSLKIN